ncbi:hypothetical protein KC887_00305 [Candidatus Kaiserbacteria bacterium]|nr:hypothetical protein [Candidatus Kaiserbacteria bacterium]
MSQRIVLPFPANGINRRAGFQSESPGSCQDAVNVRLNDSIAGRDRGGSRPGMERVHAANTTGPIRMLHTLRFFQNQQNKSRLVASAGGVIFMENDVGSLQAVSYAGNISSWNQVQAVDSGGKLYIINTGRSASGEWVTYGSEYYDRANCGGGAEFQPYPFYRPCYYGDASSIAGSANIQSRIALDGPPKVFDPTNYSIANLTADEDKGTVPTGCSIGTLYRGRLFLAGDYSNPQQWYASRAGVFTDWDYAADDRDPSRAVSGTNSYAGVIAAPITALAPHSDLCMVMSASTQMWILRGDPTTGNLDQLSTQIGIIDKNAWCHTADGWLVFLSQDGLWAMPNQCGVSDGNMVPISRPRLPEELLNIDPFLYSVSLAYDVRDIGIHVFISPNFPTSDTAQHWWLDWTNRSFWRVECNSNCDPMITCTRRDIADSNSLVMLGCRDGYIRRFSRSKQHDDDEYEFSSHVVYPAISGEGDSEFIVKGIVAKLASGTGPIKWGIRGNVTSYEAYAGTAIRSGIWRYFNKLLTTNSRMRIRAGDFSVKLEAATPGERWAIEQVVLELDRVSCAGGCK